MAASELQREKRGSVGRERGREREGGRERGREREGGREREREWMREGEQ